MIRIEVLTEHKTFVVYESNVKEGQEYIQSLKDNGVIIKHVGYYNRDEREQNTFNDQAKPILIDNPDIEVLESDDNVEIAAK